MLTLLAVGLMALYGWLSFQVARVQARVEAVEAKVEQLQRTIIPGPCISVPILGHICFSWRAYAEAKEGG